MNKKKEIEAMAKVLYGQYCGNDECGKCKMPNCAEYQRAELLYNAGFSNVIKYKKEIERLETELSHREEDLIHADENVSRREWNVALAETEIKKKAVKAFADKVDARAQYLEGDGWDEYNEGFKGGVRETLSLMFNFITELYGVEEGVDMNALSIFHKLGFELYNSGEDFLLYKYGNANDEMYVRFDLTLKSYSVYAYRFKVYSDDDFIPMSDRTQIIRHCSTFGRWVAEVQFVIDIKLHNAITEQMRELGWI